MNDLLSSVAQQAVTGVTFRSTVTPPYRYDPWAPSEPAPPNPLLALLRPAVDVETAAGPVTIAPYGEPTENYAPVVAVGGLAAIVGLVVLIGWAARAIK